MQASEVTHWIEGSVWVWDSGVDESAQHMRQGVGIAHQR